MSSVNAVGHSACAGAASGGQCQRLTIEHTVRTDNDKCLLTILFCQDDVQDDGEVLVVVAGSFQGNGDGVTVLAAGNRVGQQTAVRCKIMLGKCDIRAVADAVFAIIAPHLSAGKPRPVWRVGMHGSVRVLLRQLDRFEAASIRLLHHAFQFHVLHRVVVVGVCRGGLRFEATAIRLVHHDFKFNILHHVVVVGVCRGKLRLEGLGYG